MLVTMRGISKGGGPLPYPPHDLCVSHEEYVSNKSTKQEVLHKI